MRVLRILTQLRHRPRSRRDNSRSIQNDSDQPIGLAGPPWQAERAADRLPRESPVTDVRRREFITLLSGAAAWPLAARAQQPDRMRRIGMLIGSAEDDPEMKSRLASFRRGLERRRWSEGRNVRIDARFAEGSAERYGPLAKELVALRP